MKILKWMHKKLNWSSEKKKPNPFSAATYKGTSSVTEPHTLLIIGTFGDYNMKANSVSTNSTTAGGDSSSQDSMLEFTVEILQELLESNYVTEQKENTINRINQHFNSEHSRLEAEGKENDTFSDGFNSIKVDFNSNSIHSLDNKKSVIGKKTLAFLLKKMFVCRSGLQPIPSFKDPLSVESRMDKIFRAMIHEKLCAQGSTSAIVINKYLENKHMSKPDNHEQDLTADRRKRDTWDTTDSEYIVLEI